ncbi:MAG: alpha-2-macroglobulin [Sphingobacteriales bacterium]|nr:alpha-2-macroglobulin [Sphingobacteriales bacterium]
MKMQQLRNLFLLLPLICVLVMNSNSQQPVKTYEKEWKKVTDLSQKALPKSALAEVKKIYTLAKKDKQEVQVIKSLVYIAELQSVTREENEPLSISEMEKELKQVTEPGSSILKSIVAGMYWNYYEQHRWQLMDRTRTARFSKTDMATWGAEDFHKKISELYLQSVKNVKQLQQTRLEAYDAIILKGNMRHLRPTLYDLLAHQALSYFENDEQDLDKPAYAFEIDQASAFDPAADFIHKKFVTRDSLSLQHKALLIYQELISFHLNDSKPDALIDADILRIEFVKSNSTHPDKDGLYFHAVNHIARQYEALPAASQAWYLLAQYYNEQANDYKPYGDTTHRFARMTAKEICEKLQLQKDSSEGKINAWNLLQSINSRSFEFSLEKVNGPELAFRSLVTYKNMEGLYLRLIKADDKLRSTLENQYDEKFWPALLKASPIKSWRQPLPVTNDLQEHKVEIKIDGLPPGEYILFASSDENFSSRKSLLGARYFYVSAISYVTNDNDYFVLHRETGQPLANASVQVWEQKYDYKQSKYIKGKGKLYTTDANGFFIMEKPKSTENEYRNYSFLLDIKYEKDRLFMNDYENDYYWYRGQEKTEDKEIISVHLFTDRAIYRPGQTLYFKGIVLSRTTKEKKAGVKQGYSTTVYLRDANYKDVDSLELKTNEFGSFSGKFQLPSGGLNGQFSLYNKTDNGQAGFKVEEYKRPKFYVDYEPVKGTYKVNDTIKVTGIAKAYAGNNIDGATVKYRVVRVPRFLYPWLIWRWWQPPTASMEITHGEAKTDKDGKFTVEFTAIPDLKIGKKFEPVFDYTVYADITDINGETRSGEKSVSVSYKALVLRSNIPPTLPADSLRSLSIRTENMNGEFEPASVKVLISKLREEKRLIRARFWERPDLFVMSKEDYINSFPYDEYDNESDFKNWEKGTEIVNKTDTVKESSTIGVQDSKFAPGFYIIEITATGKNGDEVKDVKYIELIDEKSTRLNRPEYLWTGNRKTTVEPGEKASIELGTAAENLFVVHQINKEQAAGYHFLTLNKEKKTFEFPATEADRGGYSAGWIFVKNSRFYQINFRVDIPWTNKELKIEYASYRDKTLPGAEEKWKLRINGYRNDKVAAEILGSMYDASLDQFESHKWSKPEVWPTHYDYKTWDGSSNFNNLQSVIRDFPEQQYKSVNKSYDEILATSHASHEYYKLGEKKLEGTYFLSYATIRPSATMDGRVLEENLENRATTDSVVFNYNEVPAQNKQQPHSGDVKIRKNFSETAFFFPELRTDITGAIEFSFTMPEALTKWKFMALAHTKDAAFGYSTKEIVTQKELMVQPNPPRFLREGDKMEFSSKIVNLTDKELTGTARLELFDATTNQSVDGWFRNAFPTQYFTVGAGQSEAVKFPVDVPYLFNKALVWRIVARSGNYSDGEENSMPVLTNRMLVTESLPLNMKGSGSRNFSFEKLRNSGSSESLQHHALTVEYTSNPAWYAVQALPYLMEYPYECAEQTWNRYYANSLAAYISNSSPKIKQVFEQWKTTDTAALMSNLQKNPELKAVLLEETPWVLEAGTEAQQKKNIALLFDMVKMSEALNSSFAKLKKMQSPNGGFVWFTGGPDDRYITQYIVTGIGHLKKLNAFAPGQEAYLKSILTLAIPYLDRKIKEDYDGLIKNKVNLKTYSPGYTEIQYLYMRSFFPDYDVAKTSLTAYHFYRGKLAGNWLKQSKYMQGMIALTLSRTGDTKTPIAILKSLKETSILIEELGRYWKNQSWGWFWYQMPVETQSLLIEAFQEAGKDNGTADELKTWLLKNKQANNWKTTKATAEACYALLIQGTNWLSIEPVVEIKLGNTSIKSTDAGAEAGTGYFKKTIEAQKINASQGEISVTVSQPPTPNPQPSTTWGSVYWQYFEDLDKITTAETPLKLSKKLFVQTNSDRGPVITPVNEGDIIKVGDKIKVRVELRVDRDMEYVHMKDMRAAALEPVNVLSSYKWQDGLGYYESTKDASTNFFFSYLRKGTYVFEYELFATHAGNFSNGVTSIQCMYAPEFSAHSEGVRINIE